MPLEPGTTVGSYTVLATLGTGGMGEVYHARDSGLGRDVALKVIRTAFESDPEYAQRFRREGHALAALSHPHIASIYAVQEVEGRPCLVLEYVPGETLADILNRGPVEVGEALRLFAQVADALEAAHNTGIIHRDLKPANIKVTPEGTAKVLDFGLAKAFGSGSSDLAGETAAHTSATRAGMVMGTVGYMSPEQARGKPLDKRTDMWAFGCVLYEALTGHAPFAEPTVSDTIAAILHKDPDWTLLPATTPPRIRHLLVRCLQRDTRARFRDAGDAKLEIEDALRDPTPEPAARRSTVGPAWWVAAAAAAVVIVVVAGALQRVQRQAAAPAPRATFAMTLSGEGRLAHVDFPAVAISPMGTHVAYVAARGTASHLIVRPLDALEAVPLAGTENAQGPFFSPDGEWLAFFADGKLKKVHVTGAPPVVLCDAAIGFGGAWGSTETIVFAPDNGSALWRVPATGGQPERVTELDAKKAEFSHRWPEILPDGRTVVYTVGTMGSWDDATIVAQRLDTGERTVLVRGGTNPKYLGNGRLLYGRTGTLHVVDFEPSSLRITGAARAVLTDVAESPDGAMQVATSNVGVAVYSPAAPDSESRALAWIDTQGVLQPLAAPRRTFSSPRLAPDGRRVAVTIGGDRNSIWLLDLTTGELSELTLEGDSAGPVWAPDGSRIAFGATLRRSRGVFSKQVRDATGIERLTHGDNTQTPGTWTPDGRALLYVESRPSTARDISLVRVGGDGATSHVVESPGNDTAPAVSPDGRWVAYVSDATGRNEVMLQVLAGSGKPMQISRSGGAEPVWRPGSSELFYRAGNQILAVDVAANPARSTVRVTLPDNVEAGRGGWPNYDASRDGTRWLVVTAAAERTIQPLVVLLGWTPGAR